MNKLIFVVIVIALGVGLWFYLLIGKDNTDEAPIAEEPAVEKTEEPEVTQIQAETEAAYEIPENSDAGMEFPTLDE